MKKIFILLLVLVACKDQPDDQKFPVYKNTIAKDGMVYTYLLIPARDTLHTFNVGQDSFKVTMQFEKVSVGHELPDVITEIDNALDEYTMSSLIYTPQNFAGDNIVNPLGWNFMKGQVFNVAHHKNTLSYLQTDGWVDFTFTGYKIEYSAEQLEGNGIAGVSVDGKPETMVDLYSPEETNNSRTVFVEDSLENNASHKIRVRYTGQRNPNSNSGNARINLDKFTTYFRQGTYYLPPNSPTKQYEQDEKK